jgi:hypothetical protein
LLLINWLNKPKKWKSSGIVKRGMTVERTLAYHLNNTTPKHIRMNQDKYTAVDVYAAFLAGWLVGVVVYILLS